MSLWYDKKKKVYASNPTDSWYIAYAKKIVSQIEQSLSEVINGHIGGITGRHSAEDIDYSSTKPSRKRLTKTMVR